MSDDSNPDNEVNRFIDNKELDEMEKHEREGSPYGGKESVMVNTSFKENDREKKMSFADLRRKSQNQFATSGINITYSEGDEKEDAPKRTASLFRRDSQKDKNKSSSSNSTPSKTSFGQQKNNTENQSNPGMHSQK